MRKTREEKERKEKKGEKKRPQLETRQSQTGKLTGKDKHTAKIENFSCIFI